MIKTINTILIIIALLSHFFLWAQVPIKTKSNELITMTMFGLTDIKGEYTFNGPLGASLKSSLGDSSSVCEISGLFKKVNYRKNDSLEAWLTLSCNFQGQINSFKVHKFYLDLKLSEQKIKLPMLHKNLKNVTFQFQKIALKKSN